GQTAAEPLLQTRDDRPCRSDRQLLPDHLEDERPKSIAPWKRVEPRARMEVRPRVDQLTEERVSAGQELPCCRIGDRGAPRALPSELRAFGSQSARRRVCLGLRGHPLRNLSIWDRPPTASVTNLKHLRLRR